MKKSRVYDLPTRVFHWLFAILFSCSFIIAKAIDDDSALYPYHMLMGIILIVLVLFRIIWGFIGTHYAKFSSFKLKPTELAAYLKEMLTSKIHRYSGHNPASSWAAVMMMILALGLGGTGFLMSRNIYKDIFEEAHELFANAFLLVVILHIAGIILHTLKHKDGVAMSMIHGKKECIEGSTKMIKPHYFVTIVFIALIGVFTFSLFQKYDTSEQSLIFLGTKYQLGETEDD